MTAPQPSDVRPVPARDQAVRDELAEALRQVLDEDVIEEMAGDLLAVLLPVVARAEKRAAAEGLEAMADELDKEAIHARGEVQQLCRAGKFAAVEKLRARAADLRPIDGWRYPCYCGPSPACDDPSACTRAAALRAEAGQ